MSDQSPKAVAMAIYDAFAKRDIPTVLNYIDPGCEFIFEGPATVPWTGHRHGIEGWTEFFGTLAANMDDLVVTMQPFAAEGDNVAVAGRYTTRVKATGKQIDSPLVHLWTVRNGRVTRLIEMANTAAEVAACTFSAAG